MNHKLRLLATLPLIFSPLALSGTNVNLVDNVDLRIYNGEPVNIIYRVKQGQFRSVSAPFSLPQAKPLFANILAEQNQVMAATSISSDEPDYREYNLDRYYIISAPSTDKEQIEQLLGQLKSNPNVETAYIEPPVFSSGYIGEGDSSTLAPVTTATVGDMTDTQYYLNGPGENGVYFGGVNARFAWTQPGGNGQEVDVISMEGGSYHFQHEDLQYPFLVIGDPAFNPGWGDHDTKSVGVMTAIENGYGPTGIVHQARQGWARFAGGSNLIELTKHLEPGSVVQLGVQYGITDQIGTYCEKQCLVPVDWADSVVDAIKYVTAKGIHVIQAAGNGDEDLDHPYFNGKFDRNLRDSGSIMVGAITAKGVRAWFSNYGSRIDSYSWGGTVTTTAGGSENNQSLYTEHFNGTSSANPILAGAVASLQGVAKAKGMGALPTDAMRSLMTQTGYLPLSNDGYIATQPDLKVAISTLLGTLPDNTAPFAIARASNDTITGAGSLMLTGDLSTDPNGDALTYQWQQVSPTAPVAVIEQSGSVNTAVQFPDSADAVTYTFQLTVSDGELSTTAAVSIAYQPENQGGICPVWEKDRIYATSGEFVSWKGNTFTNQWWTKGEEPNVDNFWGAWKVVTEPAC